MSELPLYQVVDWNNQFENNRSRTVDHCTFVCVPNDEGPTVNAIMNHSDGHGILGVWLLILKLCSRQRKGRHGYLTTNGQRDGWRLGADELGHMWKIPPDVIRRALVVLQSPQVDLIRVVSGSSEVRASLPVPSEVTFSNVTCSETSDAPSLPVPSEVTFENVTRSVLNDVNERRNEGMNEPPSIPQGGTEMNFNGSEDPDPKTSLSVTPEVTPGNVTRSDDMNVEDAKAWVNSLFGRQREWSYEEQSELSRLLPISKEDRALLSWAYTLPRDSDGWALIKGHRASKPKHSILLLVREFSSEIDKWQSARKSTGLNGLNDKPLEREEDADLTPEQVAAAKKIYGADVPLPRKWGELAGSVRAEITEAMK